MSASTSLFKKNGGMNHTRKSWTEYPVGTKQYRDNWEATFGKKPKRKRKAKPKPPNPGSEEAQKLGCTCPVWDNEWGDGYCHQGHRGIFVISGGCPIHNLPSQNEKSA